VKKRISLSIAVALALSAGIAGVAWAFSMGGNTDYTADTNPIAIVVASIRNNGILDIIVSNFTSSTVSVFLGNGDGTFQAKADYATGTHPFVLATGSLRGNGIVDLVTPNLASSSYSVLLGTGSGTFGAATSTATTFEPNAIALADFNGDGVLDMLVVESNYLNEVTITPYQGNGNGTFTVKTATTVPGAVGNTAGYGVATGSLRNNGVQDFVLTVLGTNQVYVFLGNGNFTFQTGVGYATPTQPLGVVIGDFNEDGILDLAVATFSGAQVVTYRGNGDGTFQAAVKAFTPVAGSSFYFPAVGDLHGSGHLDIVAPNYNGAGTANVQIAAGNGDGTFQAPTSLNAGTDAGPYAVAVGDFNGDGKLDVACVNYTQGNVSVWLQTTADVRGETPGSTLLFNNLPNVSGAFPRRVNSEHGTPSTVKGE
jgi:FG-GAP-like repeat